MAIYFPRGIFIRLSSIFAFTNVFPSMNRIQGLASRRAGPAAADEHVATPVGSHVGQRHGPIVKQLIRDRPGHAALKRGLSGRALISGPVVFRGTALEALAPGCRPQRRCPKRNGPCVGGYYGWQTQLDDWANTKRLMAHSFGYLRPTSTRAPSGPIDSSCGCSWSTAKICRVRIRFADRPA